MKRREFMKDSLSLASGFYLGGFHRYGNKTGRVTQHHKKVDILMSHYTWYTYENWFGNIVPHTRPYRMPYHSADPIVAAEQNTEKDRFGIGVDLVSWWGPPNYSYEYFKNGYMQASNFETRKFGFLYEIYGRLKRDKINDCFDFDDQDNARQLLDDVDYLEKNYFKYSNYFKINDKPVLYIWAGNLKNFNEVSKKARDKVYLIGSEPIFFPPWRYDIERSKKLQCYDAITDYGCCPIYIAKKYGELTDECINEYSDAVCKWNEILSLVSPDVELILPLQFSYHDNNGDVDINDGKSRVWHFNEQQSIKFMKKTISLIDTFPRIKRVNITAYNEHWEGTGIEAGHGYDFKILSLIKKYLKDYKSGYIGSEYLIKNSNSLGKKY